jgi:SsrA-binding protein
MPTGMPGITAAIPPTPAMPARPTKQPAAGAERDIARNKKARHDFDIRETLEAGIELRGTEVKSIRAGKANIQDAFARIEGGQLWLYGSDIQPYENASFAQHAAKRPRRLLLHRKEIDKLFGATQIKGQALVALRMYFKGQRVKVELGVGKGKHHGDRREDVKKLDARREVDRELARLKRR